MLTCTPKILINLRMSKEKDNDHSQIILRFFPVYWYIFLSSSHFENLKTGQKKKKKKKMERRKTSWL